MAMILTSERKAYLQLHVAVFLFGFTAILGDLINLSALVMVWWRVLITSLSLIFFVKLGELLKHTPRSTVFLFMQIGVLVGLHWLCFYGSIKLANASVALVCMATTSFFTALIEPIVLKTKVKKYELAFGLLIIPGMVLIVSDLNFKMVNGLFVGLLAAVLATLFSVLNKKHIKAVDEISITFLELGSAWLFLTIILPFVFMVPDQTIQFWPSSFMDWIYILILSLLCTTFAYVLSLKALHHLSAFASNLTFNMEPVYGILLALFILNDSKELSPTFYWGVLIILLAVFSYPIIKRNRRKSNQG